MRILNNTFQKKFLLLLIGIGIFISQTISAFAIGVCTVNRLNTATQIPVGIFPRQIAAGDLNDDGAPDAVVVNGSSSGSSGTSVSVLLNDRRGGFVNFTNINYNLSILGVTLNDFNQDGTLDLAVAGTNSSGSGATSALTVYFNNGNAVFTSQRTTNFPGSVTALATGDFNGDGALDAALANAPGSGNFGTVTILLNNGFGNFAVGGNFSVGGNPRAVGVADFNQDGIQDVVTVNANTNGGSLLLGAGGGNFQVASNFAVTTNSSSFFQGALAVGDLNNDSRPDLVVVSGDSSVFYTLLNTGGSFAAATPNTLSNTFSLTLRSVVIAQTVGDANPDLNFAVSGNFSDGISAAAVVPGSGNGIFNAASVILAPTGTTPLSIAVADFNGDGRNDLATANNSSNDVSVLTNTGTDRFGPNTFPTVPAPTVIAAADFNGDGNLDTATSTLQTVSTGGNVTISFGNGAGGVASTQTFSAVAGNVQSLLAADVNGDARPDLIVGGTTFSSGAISVFINTGNAASSFSTPPQASFTLNFGIRMLALGDFNGDGRRDLIVTSSSSNSIAVLTGSATGVFAAPNVFAAPVSNSVTTTGDFNNDGRLDLLVAGTASNGTGGIFTLLGGGNGGFTQGAESIAINNPTSLASGDFNGDGILDLAVTGTPNFSSNGNTVSVALGTGGGRFGALNTFTVGLDARSVVAADFNGDSRLDLAVANRASNSISILTNIGGGNFAQADNFLAGIFPEQLVVGDFNRDGRTDAATVNRGGNNFSIITNSCREAVSKTDYDGDGNSDFAVFRPSELSWFVFSSNLRDTRSARFGSAADIQTPGDYDGDGITDFAVFRPSNGTWYILRSSTNRSFSVAFGANADVPVANDYDGDGRTDIAVFRPSNGTWYIRQSANLQNQFISFPFGISTDRPVPADYDGDGRADIAVYRGGLWIVSRSSNSSVIYQPFGLASDVTVPGDYDGDGRTDFAVFRSGVWFILNSTTNSLRAENFGAATDRVQPADYDGDGRTDVAVWREGTEGFWYVLRSRDRQVTGARWGTTGDLPVTALYRY